MDTNCSNTGDGVMMDRRGALVVSLDFELFWGVRDNRTLLEYGAHVLGERLAIPEILRLFSRFGIHATWATLGFLFAAHKDELMECCPAIKPSYADPRMSPYPYISSIGESEDVDQFHFGLSLVDQIGRTADQEIATHTFSHFYTLEDGASLEAFSADIEAARQIAARRGYRTDSIVFPRNQYGPGALAICRRQGIRAYRGTPMHPFYLPRRRAQENALVRIGRNLDSLLPLSGRNCHRLGPSSELLNIPASRFLYPHRRNEWLLVKRRLKRISADLIYAAQRGLAYHLWWHPHNFGLDVGENVALLAEILGIYASARDRYGMLSLNMRDCCCLAQDRGSAGGDTRTAV